MKRVLAILIGFYLSLASSPAQQLVPLNTENTGEYYTANSSIPTNDIMGNAATTFSGNQDNYWKYASNSASDTISSDSYGETPGASVGAVLITTPAVQWYKPSTGSWVGPSPNQGNSGTNNGGNAYGYYNYTLTFQSNSVQKVDIIGMFAADNETEIVLNGNVIQGFGSQQFTSLNSFDFVNEVTLMGANTFQFIVDNDGNTASPTGLYVTDFEIYAVPEPSTWAIILLGLGGVGFARYRAQRVSPAIATELRAR